MLRSTLALLIAAVSLPAQVSFDRLLHAGDTPQDWLNYSGGYLSQRYSALDQIAPGNVANLEQKWIFQARSLEKFEATPLVVDGVMYTVQAPNDIVALDAVTGRIFWIYSYSPAPQARLCCGRVNRGLAILGDTLFMGTIAAVEHQGGQPRSRVRHHARAAGGQGQGDRRNRGRRIWHPRIPGCLRRSYRQGNMALQ
jgi:glucose dehydrogenase